MSLTYVISEVAHTSAVANHDSASVSVAVDDIIVWGLSAEDNFTGEAFTPSQASGTATIGSITTIAATNTASNAKVVVYWAKVTGAGTFVARVASPSCRGHSFLIVHTGGHSTTPVPTGNIFSGTGATDPSQSITPTSSGSCLWMICGDWNAIAVTAMSAGTSCTEEYNNQISGWVTTGIYRPTTQPRTDASAFTISESDTGGKIAWVAFEVQAEAGGGGGITESDASSTGTASDSVVASATFSSVSSSSGVSSESILSSAVIGGDSSASGASAESIVSVVINGGVASSTGVSSDSIVSSATIAGVSSSNGVSTDSVISGAIAESIASSDGISTASGDSENTATGSDAVSTGIAVVSGVSANIAGVIAISDGLSSISGISGAISGSVASAGGLSDALGLYGSLPIEADANSSGTCNTIAYSEIAYLWEKQIISESDYNIIDTDGVVWAKMNNNQSSWTGL